MGSAVFAGFALRALVIVTGAILWGDGTLCGTGWCAPGPASPSLVTAAEVPILRKMEIAYWLNFVVVCWQGIMSSAFDMKVGAHWMLSLANGFTAVSFFILALDMDLQKFNNVAWYVTLRPPSSMVAFLTLA